MKLHEYYKDWVELYKRGAVRPVTLEKFLNTQRWIKSNFPEIGVRELDKRKYQMMINKYSETHEKQTVIDFHRNVKPAILDAMDEGLIKVDPTRKVTLKGKPPSPKKPKYISREQLHALLKSLSISNKPDWDLFVLLLAKTGLRFSEALGLTKGDFDIPQHTLSISKTWNYKNAEGGFGELKNRGSKRVIAIDPQLCAAFQQVFQNSELSLKDEDPIFARTRVFNSTVISHIKTLCERAGVPVISTHGLRHTHASILLYEGISILNISKRLGHSETTTTQEVYLHIIKELEEKESERIVQCLSELF